MRPFLFVYSEVSADGKTTHRLGASSKPMMRLEDEFIRKYRHSLRSDCDAIMVGSNTIRIDNPHLTVRHVTGKNPLRVIVNSSGDIPTTSNVFTDGERTLLAVSNIAPAEKISAFRNLGVEVVSVGETVVDLAKLLEHLHKIGIASVMAEGGATLLSSLFRANLVDRLVVQHLPTIFGGKNTPSMVGGDSILSIEQAIPLRLAEVKQIGGHAVIIYNRE